MPRRSTRNSRTRCSCIAVVVQLQHVKRCTEWRSSSHTPMRVHYGMMSSAKGWNDSAPNVRQQEEVQGQKSRHSQGSKRMQTSACGVGVHLRTKNAQLVKWIYAPHAARFKSSAKNVLRGRRKIGGNSYSPFRWSACCIANSRGPCQVEQFVSIATAEKR